MGFGNPLSPAQLAAAIAGTTLTVTGSVSTTSSGTTPAATTGPSVASWAASNASWAAGTTERVYVLVGTKVYGCGGRNNTLYTTACQVWDTTTDTIATAPALPTATVRMLGANDPAGNGLLIGGQSAEDGTPLTTIRTVDKTSGAIATAAYALPAGRVLGGVAWNSDYLFYALGASAYGTTNTPVRTVYRYSFSAGTWATLTWPVAVTSTSLSSAQVMCVCFILGTTLYVVSRQSGSYSVPVAAFDVWTDIGSPPGAAYIGAAVASNGAGIIYADSLRKYDPTTGVFSTLTAPARSHSAIVGTNSKLWLPGPPGSTGEFSVPA